MTANGWRRLSRWVSRLLLSAVLVLVAGAAVVLIVLPKLTHGMTLTVLSGSMTPRIPVGSVVLVVPADPETLRVGDVATYQTAPGKAEFITHRIVDIDTTTTPMSFTFKGDANPGADLEPVPAGAIRGELWFHVPYLGAIRDSLQTGGGLAAAGMVLFSSYALYQFGGAAWDYWRKKRAGKASGQAPAAGSS